MAKATRPAAARKKEGPLHAARRALEAVRNAAANDTPEGQPTSVKWRVAIADAMREVAKQELLDRYGHRRGTPETLAKHEAIPARQREGALARMAMLGKVTIDELAAAQEIIDIAEMIERGVSVRSASLEARVDGSGSGRDVLVEGLGRIRAEVAYTAWRQHIPMPRAMILDMIVRDKPYVAAARAYNLNYRTARKRLISSLRLWMELKDAAYRDVTDDAVQAVYARLGEGALAHPLPKHPSPTFSR